MTGLNGTLAIATGALAAQTAGLEVANNNISNANTAGYSRQEVSLSSAAMVQGTTTVDQGVSYGGFTSVRDTVLNIAVNNAASQQSSYTEQSTLLSAVNSAFSGTETGIGAAMSTMFSDLSALSTTPSDASARQTVLGDASQLANAFNQGAAALSSATSAADRDVSSTVAQVNQLTQQIASLNSQLASLPAGQDGGAVEDQRDQLTNQLAQLVGVSETQTQGTPTLTTAGGSPLVIGDTAYPLQTVSAADGTTHVLDSQGDDITSNLTGGTLGGAIAVRDNALPSLAGQLDSLVSRFASAMNSAQSSGFDLSGAPGSPLFTVPTTGSAAAGISVALTNGSGIAVSSDGTTGSSGNLTAILGVQSAALSGGATPSASYASLVSEIGNAGEQANNSLSAASTSLQQLTTQQQSESGVSIDEETSNLLRYQQAYAASARVISTVNDMYTTLMNISLGD